VSWGNILTEDPFFTSFHATDKCDGPRQPKTKSSLSENGELKAFEENDYETTKTESSLLLMIIVSSETDDTAQNVLGPRPLEL
jgi:hypothetical protein